jgi:cellulose synthase/poly-beta-1,6-N-acetylglucosamine synthase-like glycosyltransferase
MLWGIAIVAYYVLYSIVAVYGAHRLVLLYRCVSGRKAVIPVMDRALPSVTVQLPLYNEDKVVQRLLHAVGRLDYPRDLLEIQVLDDSTDGTTALVEKEVTSLRAAGLSVCHLRREVREGFKAGALKAGLENAKGEVLAIFDADFVPPRGFLRQVLPYLGADVGMVQARWAFLHPRRSFFTRAQAILLHGHFVVEHVGRFRSGCWFNFNGTAGVWRREAIQDAGGWEGDTLTEDLDLSYRAQLAGWRFVYLKDVTVPSELPRGRDAFLGQQVRWAQGGIQTARKLLGRIWASGAERKKKVEATVHLTGNVGYLILVLLCLLLPAVLYGRWELGLSHRFTALDAILFFSAVCPFWLVYGVSLVEAGEFQRWSDLLLVPLALALGVGLSLSQSQALLRGLGAEVGEFVRTEKAGTQGHEPLLGNIRLGEGLLCVWAAVAVGVGVFTEQLASLPFSLLFMLGYGWIAVGEPLTEWLGGVKADLGMSATESAAGSHDTAANHGGSVQDPVRGSK